MNSDFDNSSPQNNLIKKFNQLVYEILNQGEGIQFFDVNHKFVHQLINYLEKTFNDGLEAHNKHEQYFYKVFRQIFENRQSVEYVKELTFLKTSKLQGQIWLLIEISDGSLIDIFTSYQTNEELQLKYCNNAIINIYLDKIKDFLDDLFKILRIQGDIINRWYAYKQKKNQAQSSIEGTTTHRNARQLKRQQTYDFSDCIISSSKGPTLTNIKILSGDEIKDDAESEDEQKYFTQNSINDINYKGSRLREREKEDDKDKDKDQDQDLKVSNQQILNIKIKNSNMLFIEKFEHFVESPKYTKISIRPSYSTLTDQNYQCPECKEQFPKAKCFFSRNPANFCYFSGKWYCSKCMNEVNSLIPWKILDNYDFKLYPVSKQAFQEIDQINFIPILQLEYYHDIVFNNNKLHNFLLLRRSLHIMFDAICDVEIFYKESKMQKKKNLLLQINLFSLQDFIEIQNGILYNNLKIAYDVIYKHMIKCEKCLKKGFTCKTCESKPKIFAFEILTTQYCVKCRSLYHRKCFPRENCIICDEKAKELDQERGKKRQNKVEKLNVK